MDYDKGSFVVGVQPNEVPQSHKVKSDTKEKINELQDKIMNLENELASLKSTISQTNSIA